MKTINQLVRNLPKQKDKDSGKTSQQLREEINSQGFVQRSGGHTPKVIMVSQESKQHSSCETFGNITLEKKQESQSTPKIRQCSTGISVGKVGAKEKTPKEKAQAEFYTALKKLPSVIGSHLNSMEKTRGGWNRVPLHGLDEHVHLTPSMQEQAKEFVEVSDKITAPCGGKALARAVEEFLSVFPFGLFGDESSQDSRVRQWCRALEKYPTWAVATALVHFRDNTHKGAPIVADAVKMCKDITWTMFQHAMNIEKIWDKAVFWDTEEAFQEFLDNKELEKKKEREEAKKSELEYSKRRQLEAIQKEKDEIARQEKLLEEAEKRRLERERERKNMKDRVSKIKDDFKMASLFSELDTLMKKYEQKDKK